MKFEKIGTDTFGGNIINSDTKNINKSDRLNFVTSCEGKKVKWNDPFEKDAVNLIVTWGVTLKHDNGFPVWNKTDNQHYRIKEKEIPATDNVIDTLIEDSYVDFRIYLENEKEEPENRLATLNPLMIQDIRQKLLVACNSETQS